MKRLLILIGAMVLLTAFASPAGAAGKGWHLRAFGVWMDPGISDSVINDDGDEIRISGSSKLGFGASAEYQFSERIGVEAGLLSASPKVKLSVDIPGFGELALEDSLSTRVLTLDLDVHLTPGSPNVDFYLGGGLASINHGDLDFTLPAGLVGEGLGIRVGDHTGWTLKAGLDYTFGESGWGLGLGLRHIDNEFEAWEQEDGPGDSETFSNDLLVGSAGVVVSF